MKPSKTILQFSFWIATLLVCLSCDQQEVLHVQQWDKFTLEFEGPETSESSEINPFLNYRLQVTFSLGDRKFVVPGFYAADGNAAETSAEGGKVWKVHFRPDTPGTWAYAVSFREGANIAVSDDPEAGKAVFFNGSEGKILVAPVEWQENDPKSKGKLVYSGSRYLQYQGSKKYFLKGGADSPENLLAYYDFDGTFRGKLEEARSGEADPKESLHTYPSHLADWKDGDPTWKGGKGKSLIGGLNYLASKGMNSVYFLTMNIEGDGNDVWPYIGFDERLRFDCSKLEQWDLVFDHMDQLGIMLHIVTQETENEKLLDGGDTKFERKLYYRELISRFAHHFAVTWNMGEENGPADFSPNGQTIEQQKAMVAYFKKHDPYNNFVVIHTHANPEHRYEIFEELLGDPNLDGPSMQIGNPASAHLETKVWIEKSKESGKQWVLNIDEIGPASRGLDPDDRMDMNNQDSIRYLVMWGNLMAGGGGAEWYFGYKNHNNDLGCEDWRSRDRMWDYTRYALEFFQIHLPFWEMESNDQLVSNSAAFCLAKPGEVYAVYNPFGEPCTLDLSGIEGVFSVQWHDPRNGGSLQNSEIVEIEGGKVVDLGSPPDEAESDWAILVQKK